MMEFNHSVINQIINDLEIEIANAATNQVIGNYKPNTNNGEFIFILQPGETFNVEYKLANQFLYDTIEVPSEGGTSNILKVITFGPLFLIYRASSMIFNFLMLTLTKDFQLF